MLRTKKDVTIGALVVITIIGIGMLLPPVRLIFDEYNAKKVVIWIGNAIQDGAFEKAKTAFTADAVFEYQEELVSHNAALNSMSEKYKKGEFAGGWYVNNIGEKMRHGVQVSYIAWFRIGEETYAASGEMTLRRIGVWC